MQPAALPSPHPACPPGCATCASPTSPHWLDLRASPHYAPHPALPPALSPSWALLLFGDCSPTRVIGLLSGAPLTVALLGMEPVGACCDGVPFPLAVAAIAPPRVRRRVWLQAGGERVGYAASWWSEAALAAFLPSRGAPIGDALSGARLEVHRELLGVACGCGHGALEEGLGRGGGCGGAGACGGSGGGGAGGGCGSELWARWYLMWHQGVPVCLIHEVFSPVLRRWLGPTRAAPAGAA